jgi:hypothetical protein
MRCDALKFKLAAANEAHMLMRTIDVSARKAHCIAGSSDRIQWQ